TSLGNNSSSAAAETSAIKAEASPSPTDAIEPAASEVDNVDPNALL
ncbi:MAG: hypothetical protein RIR26_2079, partial [Pseudomonadota bacterium]